MIRVRRESAASVALALIALFVMQPAAAEDLCAAKKLSSDKSDILTANVNTLYDLLIDQAVELAGEAIPDASGTNEDKEKWRRAQSALRLLNGLDCLLEKIKNKQVVEIAEGSSQAGAVLKKSKTPPDGCAPDSCIGFQLEYVCPPIASNRIRSYLVPLHESVHFGQPKTPGTGYKSFINCDDMLKSFLAAYNEVEAVTAEMSLLCDVVKHEYATKENPPAWTDDDEIALDELLEIACDYAKANLAIMASAIIYGNAVNADPRPDWAASEDPCSPKVMKLMEGIKAACEKKFDDAKTPALEWAAEWIDAR
ncbi:MAG: hypothetical protein QNJ98_09645 [Planctomycetota bacterium]|nr:hypothetical protein [Planctomycetota bacterium]